jgi:hypothetical protein
MSQVPKVGSRLWVKRSFTGAKEDQKLSPDPLAA